MYTPTHKKHICMYIYMCVCRSDIRIYIYICKYILMSIHISSDSKLIRHTHTYIYLQLSISIYHPEPPLGVCVCVCGDGNAVLFSIILNIV